MMSDSLFVDTSGWAYLADRHDPFHTLMRTAYDRALQEQRLLVTSNYIVAELIALLSSRSRISRQQILTFADSLDMASFIEVVHIDRALHKLSIELLKARVDKEWSLVDASSFVIMRHRGIIEALTTDHHFEQAGFVRLPKP